MKQFALISMVVTALAACGGGSESSETPAATQPSSPVASAPTATAPTVTTPSPPPAVELDGKVRVYVSSLQMSQYSQGEQNCMMEYTVENGTAEQISFALARYRTIHTEYQSGGAMMVPRPVDSGQRDRKELDLKGGHACEGLQEVRVIQLRCTVGSGDAEKSCVDVVEVGDSVNGVSMILEG